MAVGAHDQQVEPFCRDDIFENLNRITGGGRGCRVQARILQPCGGRIGGSLGLGRILTDAQYRQVEVCKDRAVAMRSIATLTLVLPS